MTPLSASTGAPPPPAAAGDVTATLRACAAGCEWHIIAKTDDITVNSSCRAYQNVLTSLGGTEYLMVLQLAPAVIGGVIQNIASAFTAVCFYNG